MKNVEKLLPQLISECLFEASRSSGPGGQNVNKVNSRITLRWQVEKSALLNSAAKARFVELYGSRLTKFGELLISAASSRDQHQNRKECLGRLVKMIAAALRPVRKRRPTRATAGSRERRLETKRVVSRKKATRRTRSFDE
jgi:ribosome-associated protein